MAKKKNRNKQRNQRPDLEKTPSDRWSVQGEIEPTGGIKSAQRAYNQWIRQPDGVQRKREGEKREPNGTKTSAEKAMQQSRVEGEKYTGSKAWEKPPCVWNGLRKESSETKKSVMKQAEEAAMRPILNVHPVSSPFLLQEGWKESGFQLEGKTLEFSAACLFPENPVYLVKAARLEITEADERKKSGEAVAALVPKTGELEPHNGNWKPDRPVISLTTEANPTIPAGEQNVSAEQNVMERADGISIGLTEEQQKETEGKEIQKAAGVSEKAETGHGNVQMAKKGERKAEAIGVQEEIPTPGTDIVSFGAADASSVEKKTKPELAAGLPSDGIAEAEEDAFFMQIALPAWKKKRSDAGEEKEQESEGTLDGLHLEPEDFTKQAWVALCTKLSLHLWVPLNEADSPETAQWLRLFRIRMGEGHSEELKNVLFLLYQEQRKQGLGVKEAFLQANQMYEQLYVQGHTLESMAARFSAQVVLTEEEQELLKEYGCREELGGAAFASGQRIGEETEPETEEEKEERKRQENPQEEVSAYRSEALDVSAKAAENEPKEADWDGNTEAAGETKQAQETPVSHILPQEPFRWKLQLFIDKHARRMPRILRRVGTTGSSVFYLAGAPEQKGVRNVTDAVVTGKAVLDLLLLGRLHGLLRICQQESLYSFLTANGAATVEEFLMQCNRELRAVGLPGFGHRTGTELVLAAGREIKRLKELLRKKQVDETAAKRAIETLLRMVTLGKLTVFSIKPVRYRLMHAVPVMTGLGMRLMQQGGEGTQGLSQTYRYARNLEMAMRAFLQVEWMRNRLMVKGLTTAVKLSAWSAGRSARVLERTGTEWGRQAAQGLTQYQRGVQMQQERLHRVKQKIKNKTRQVKQFIKDPFRLKQRVIQWTGRKAAALAKGHKVIGMLKTGVSGLVEGIVELVLLQAKIKRMLMVGALIAFLLFLLLSCIQPLIQSVAGIFRADLQETSIKEVIVTQLADCYEEDMDRILRIASRYGESEIRFDDSRKDTEAYAKWMQEAETEVFSQTTNAAELIAMTMVRFSYDLSHAEGSTTKEVSEREVRGYLKKLYHSSHRIEVAEETVTLTVDTGERDSEGNAITQTVTKTKAVITYHTIYFEELFEPAIAEGTHTKTPVDTTDGTLFPEEGGTDGGEENVTEPDAAAPIAEKLVSYAVQFEGRIHYTQGTQGYTGTRYLGSDLSKAVYTGGTPVVGTDCSGFMYSIYKHFGYTIPTNTRSYGSTGKHSLSDLRTGDILWRSGHVGMYIGNGKLIEAARCRGGDHAQDLRISTYRSSEWTWCYRFY